MAHITTHARMVWTVRIGILDSHQNDSFRNCGQLEKEPDSHKYSLQVSNNYFLRKMSIIPINTTHFESKNNVRPSDSSVLTVSPWTALYTLDSSKYCDNKTSLSPLPTV